jgi:hypothetical protein
MHRAYNQRLQRRAGNGVIRGNALETVWKTSWFVLH